MTRREERSDCVLCQLGGVAEGGQLPGTDLVVAYVDDELIGLVPTERPGVLLAPREHIQVLPRTPEASAAILAPLRQLVEQVRSFYGVTEAKIEPTTDLPKAPGHVCFHVTPDGNGGGSPRSYDIEVRVNALAEGLRRNAAAHPKQRSNPHSPRSECH
jgi:hypothetical protein